MTFQFNILVSEGFKQCQSERCLFYKIEGKEMTFVVVHVDDLNVSSNSSVHIDKFIKKYEEVFGKMKWMTDEINYLSLHIRMNVDHSVTIDMAAYVQKVLKKRFKLDMLDEFPHRRGYFAPSEQDFFENWIDDGKEYKEIEVTEFLSCLMELNYMVTHPIRLDIEKEISKQFFEKNIEMFKYNGGDMENLWHLTKIVHSRRIFGKSNNLVKRITLTDLENGFKLYCDNEEVKSRKDDISKYIYNTMYV
jgi:hypothetical protein